MEIKGKVHCLFEQSGTFKNEFKKLGYDAYDYDIQNNFNETDYVIDLFKEIENAYEEKPSVVWDDIMQDDLILAFFPCIYFETIQMCYYQLTHNNNRSKPMHEKINDAIERVKSRTDYHILLYKMVGIACKRKLRLIIENPATTPSYIVGSQNFPNPTMFDNNRMLRGDYYMKPTAYWFFNCEPTSGKSYQKPKERKKVLTSKGSEKAGVCSTERSMISPDYARNFICDFILGKPQKHTELTLF